MRRKLIGSLLLSAVATALACGSSTPTVAVQPCAVATCSADASCTELGGVAHCTCNAGFVGDGATCAPAASCAKSNGGCSANATCSDGTGAITCACKDGFVGDGVTCTEKATCAKNNGGCDANAVCTDSTGAVSCLCKLGYVGDGKSCLAVAGTLQGLRWELPCLSDSSSTVCNAAGTPTTKSTTLGGAAGVSYDITVRFRGVVETKQYSGGVAGNSDDAGVTSPYFYTGGTPIADNWNVYGLTVSDPPQTYYVNNGTTGLFYCVPLDYTATIRVKAGATVTLNADAIDASEITGKDTGGTPIVIPGPAPLGVAYDGQFVQMDIVKVTAVP